MGEKDMILVGLKQAMQAEADGHNFYKMAANSTGDDQGKEVFNQLAKDEIDHYTFLKEQYESFAKDGKPNMNIRLGQPSNNADSPIFSENFKERLQDAHYEMTALSIGVQLELSAINFYKAESAKYSDPTVKKFYADLAEWESTHYHMLLKQQEELKEDYWRDSNFYPF
jgi:rubrerythrin